jgi:hypothetical protein
MVKKSYLDVVMATRFRNIAVKNEKQITLTDETLRQHLNNTEFAALKNSGECVYSTTAYGEKA